MESRVSYLENMLSNLGYNDSLRAMDWMMEEMCAEKGYKRHNGSHYYYHLIDAAQDALNFGIREEPVITGILLHDSIEDIPGVTAKMIESLYGTRVAISVDLVTKKEDVDYKIAENVKEYLFQILQNRDSSLMKTADRKHNFSTLRDATPEKKLKQAIETEKFFIPFFKDCRKKYVRYSSYFFSAKTAIEPHLWEIKEHFEEVKLLKEEIERLKSGSKSNAAV
ncbi:GTP pyrophosphokinase [Brevibacillus sp. NPDC058079]|uniref:GTP pyrophosphokinase n=1 Tax=Brevibacillus sp. NPDC058079 TaxID=3346330 RepID=UPI0036EF02F1